MNLRPTVLAIAGCAMLCATVLAQTTADGPAPGAHEQFIARFERLSDAQLKAYFLRCSRDATRRMLGLNEGALCSAAQDALKKSSFAGNFDALLAWWRVHRDDPVDEERGGGKRPVEAPRPGLEETQQRTSALSTLAPAGSASHSGGSS